MNSPHEEFGKPEEAGGLLFVMAGICEMCPVVHPLWTLNVDITEPKLYSHCQWSRWLPGAMSFEIWSLSVWELLDLFLSLIPNIPGKPKRISTFRTYLSHAIAEQVLRVSLNCADYPTAHMLPLIKGGGG